MPRWTSCSRPWPAPAPSRACLQELVQDVAEREINAALIAATVEGIADIRASDEGREGRAVVPARSASPPGWADPHLNLDAALAPDRAMAPHRGAARRCGQRAGGGHAAARATRQLDMPGLLALAAALGWASGFRLYAVVFHWWA